MDSEEKRKVSKKNDRTGYKDYEDEWKNYRGKRINNLKRKRPGKVNRINQRNKKFKPNS